MENEKRLIDANKLIDFIDVGHLRQPGELCWSELDVANLLLNAQTINAAEVIRCLECKYLDKDDGLKYGRMCLKLGNSSLCHDDDFCSYGERKEGAD